MEHLDVSFENLAKMLFQDFHIEKDGVRYDFLEVKFYFFKIDDIEEAGKCFFHMNGLYISFGSKFVYWGKGKFIAYSGRIWIRSILKKEKEKEAENCEKLKELEQLFAGDPETRMKEAARQVEAWKQDYRRMA